MVYTGIPRLAKNTLINALRKHSVRPLNAKGEDFIVGNLVDAAELASLELSKLVGEYNYSSAEGEDMKALLLLGETLNHYWQLKTQMAPGSEPPHVTSLLHALKPYCLGSGLCGAGAGGFAVCILRPEIFSTEKNIFQDFSQIVKEIDPLLTTHQCSIDIEGVSTKILLETKPLKQVLRDIV